AGLRIRYFSHVSLDSDLTAERLPVEEKLRLRIREKLDRFSALVIRVKTKPAVTHDILQKNDATRGFSLRRRRHQHHRLGERQLERLRFRETGVEKFVRGLRRIHGSILA